MQYGGTIQMNFNSFALILISLLVMIQNISGIGYPLSIVEMREYIKLRRDETVWV